MDNKNIDGVKKLSSEEIAKSRKLVLDAIAEAMKENEPKPVSAVASEKKKAETKKEDDNALIIEDRDKKGVNLLPKALSDIKKINEEKPTKEQVATVKAAIENESKKASQAVPKQSAPKPLPRPIVFMKPEKKKGPKNYEDAVTKIKNDEMKNAVAYKPYQPKILKTNKTDNKKSAEPLKSEESLEKSGAQQTIAGAGSGIKKFFAKLVNFILIIFVLGIFVYLLYSLVLLKFDIDNAFTRQVSAYVKVPAVITKQGYIDYFTYKEIADRSRQECVQGSDCVKKLRYNLARSIIIGELWSKYNLSTGAKLLYVLSPDQEKTLNRQILYDKEINVAPYNRIQKVDQMISSGNDYIDVASKYGDAQGTKEYANLEAAKSEFGEEISKLQPGQVSGVLYGPDGYYVMKRYDSDTSYAYGYVMIKAKNLSDFIDEAAENLRMWSLVKLE